MNLQLNVVRFENEDIIATSGESYYYLTGLMNGVKDDATFKKYSAPDLTGAFIDVKSTYLTAGYSFNDGSNTIAGDEITSNKDGSTEQTIINLYGAGHDYGSSFNGWYTFDSTTGTFNHLQ